MKLIIKEQLWRIGFPETTDMKPPSQPVKIKGASKKVKPSPNDSLTTQCPSYFEHVDKRFPDSPTPKSQKSQKSSNKGARISKPPPTTSPPQVQQVSTPIPTPISPSIKEVQIALKIPFIDKMTVFMHKYIDRIINVVEDGNCRFRAVLALLGKGEDAHELVRHDLIKELVNHKDSYTRISGDETKFESVNEALVPWGGAYAPFSHWMRFPDMGHLIASAYDIVCIDLRHYSFSETFFPLRTTPPTNPIDRIICVGWIAKSRHFVQVYLKPGCPIPPTSPKWALYHTEVADTWLDLLWIGCTILKG
ncbi:uncharacterized protein LOC131622494 [Vicia villosa]|uniref:uncharacterized protein LOC131622494 n=1 Tax=Vicia villosa TaxID=3911 RepID=UPI00273AF17F|nr:uncharacterized protein LOC131622494 [Vicia villosa]